MTLEVRCPGCEATTAAKLLATDEAFAVLECGHCGAHLRVAVGASTVEQVEVAEAESGTPAAGQMSCPKCETVQDQAPACRVCGLHAEHMESFANEAEQGGALAAAWAELEEQWSNAEAHERFIEQVVAGKHFAEAARRYRRRVRTGDPVAPLYLERVGSMAAALLSLGPEPKLDEPAEPFRGVAILLFALVAIAVALGVLVVGRMS